MRVLWLSNFTSNHPLEDRMYLQLCAEELQKMNVETVFCHHSPMTIHHRQTFFEVKWRGFRCIYPMRNLISTIRAINPNIVLLNSFNTNLMRELEDINREYPTGVLPHRLTPDLAQFLLNVDCVIAQSMNAKNILETLGCEDITVILPSIGTRPITECSDPTIVTLSPITPIKNHITLLEAISLVKHNISDVELAMIGQGNLKPMCEQMIELLNLQVKIISQVSLNTLFREVRVMALPSFSETAPLSILESYARGVPCVVSRSGWGDLFTSALKANSDNPREWADHLTNLLSDWDLYDEVRKNQLSEVKEKFSPGNIKEYVHVFEELDELNRYKIKRIMKKVA
ncbi:hypothetical protein ES707_03392 [subsurface metagenome]